MRVAIDRLSQGVAEFEALFGHYPDTVCVSPNELHRQDWMGERVHVYTRRSRVMADEVFSSSNDILSEDVWRSPALQIRPSTVCQDGFAYLYRDASSNTSHAQWIRMIRLDNESAEGNQAAPQPSPSLGSRLERLRAMYSDERTILVSPRNRAEEEEPAFNPATDARFQADVRAIERRFPWPKLPIARAELVPGSPSPEEPRLDPVQFDPDLAQVVTDYANMELRVALANQRSAAQSEETRAAHQQAFEAHRRSLLGVSEDWDSVDFWSDDEILEKL